ncbi:MAG: tyrosine-type recombinase/integrase [Candidatus Omnitrophica bacterium]|nr:tyrosine-type recombinase/integrase [Candidatus Omnitrophota bacterium]
MGKDFDKATIDDYKKAVGELEQLDWEEATKQAAKITLKVFLRWLYGTKEDPQIIQWLEIKARNNNRKLPEDMLTEEDIKLLIDNSKSVRDRAFLITLYESGCRIGELLPIKIKNVHFDEYGAQLLVDGKTGMRRVRIISATPYLTEWINKHPLRQPEAPLWITSNKTRWAYTSLKKMLRVLRVRSGLKKRLYPHIFRHSRATYLANHLTEAQLKEIFGWSRNSNMAATYVHLSGRDVDNALLRTYGIKLEEKVEPNELKPKVCPRCNEVNPATNQICAKCSMIIDERMRNKLIEDEFNQRETDKIIGKMLETHPEFKQVFMTAWGNVFEELSSNKKNNTKIN